MRNAALNMPNRPTFRPPPDTKRLVIPLGLALVTSGCAAREAHSPPGAPITTTASAASSPLVSPEEPPADPKTLAVPGPAASPCTNDSMCINHRCNLEYGKCAFPCASDADCVRGAFCFSAVISTCQRKPPNE